MFEPADRGVYGDSLVISFVRTLTSTSVLIEFSDVAAIVKPSDCSNEDRVNV